MVPSKCFLGKFRPKIDCFPKWVKLNAGLRSYVQIAKLIFIFSKYFRLMFLLTKTWFWLHCYMLITILKSIVLIFSIKIFEANFISETADFQFDLIAFKLSCRSSIATCWIPDFTPWSDLWSYMIQSF